MSKYSDNIKKIVRSAELEAKIKQANVPINRGEWEGGRGIGLHNNQPEDVCPLFYSTNPNSFDIAELLAGTVGPTIADQCSRLDTITGLTDFDVSEAIDSAGATVFLTVQLDGIFD